MARTVSSAAPDTAEAVLEIGEELAAFGPPSPRDAALVFASAHHGADPVALSAALVDIFGEMPFIGWIGACAFDGMRLMEGAPGLSVLVLEHAAAYARTAPPAELGSHVAAGLVADMPPGRSRLIAVPAMPFDVDNFIPVIDEQPVPLAGAVCAGMPAHECCALGPGLTEVGSSSILCLDDRELLIGVAQASRPLGPARTITRSDKGIIHEIDGRPAMEVLLGDLPEQQRADLTTLRGRLFAGLAAADGSAFVMRHVLGTDTRTGALAVAGRPQLGAEVMFSMLDGAAARDDLEATLHSLSQTLQGRRPEAVLLFDCAARGEPLMGVPLYDVERTIDVLGHGERVPVVGLMGGGEIARLDTITQVFGYTVVVAALLRPD